MSNQPAVKIKPKISSVMWKTVSEACNLACDYCYYSTCNGRPGKFNQIEEQTLEKFIKEYMEMSQGLVSFIWQGGEPLLAGLDFFEKVVYYQKKYSTKFKRASNSIQTNGTLINKYWAQFFSQHGFFVGVSLDGPKEINDQRRVTRTGKPSFDLVMRGIEHLRNHRVEFNILTVIHETNVHRAKDLMNFYQQENFPYVQFIPCMDFKAQQVEQPGVFTITPEEYGSFLCEAFDHWYHDGQPITSVRFFDNMLTGYLNQTAEHCIHQETCPKALVFEQNGDAYPCDFYMDEAYRLGNITVASFEDIATNPKLDTFVNQKKDFPETCKSCEFLKLCQGGCPRNRHNNASEDEQSKTYFCHSYKRIYRYAHNRMKLLADKIKQDKLQTLIKAGYPLPKDSDMCMCGSNITFSSCCKRLMI